MFSVKYYKMRDFSRKTITTPAPTIAFSWSPTQESFKDFKINSSVCLILNIINIFLRTTMIQRKAWRRFGFFKTTTQNLLFVCKDYSDVIIDATKPKTTTNSTTITVSILPLPPSYIRKYQIDFSHLINSMVRILIFLQYPFQCSYMILLYDSIFNFIF